MNKRISHPQIKMKVEDLHIPITQIELISKILSRKEDFEREGEEGHYRLSESTIIEILQALGAVRLSVKDKNELPSSKMNDSEVVLGEGSVIQRDSTHLPKAIVELMQKEKVNLIKAIMIYKKMSLKEVAERYGGKSGAANMANFMAKSPEDLTSIRASTFHKIAHALDCPYSWLAQVKD